MHRRTCMSTGHLQGRPALCFPPGHGTQSPPSSPRKPCNVNMYIRRISQEWALEMFPEAKITSKGNSRSLAMILFDWSCSFILAIRSSVYFPSTFDDPM